MRQAPPAANRVGPPRRAVRSSPTRATPSPASPAAALGRPHPGCGRPQADGASPRHARRAQRATRRPGPTTGAHRPTTARRPRSSAWRRRGRPAPGWSANHRVSGISRAAACRVAPSSRPPVVKPVTSITVTGTGPARRVRAPTASAQTTTSTTRTPEGGSGSHTPATTPTSSATAAGAVGFVTSGRMQDPSRPEPPVSGGSSAQGCGFCAPAVLQLLRFLRSEGTRQGVNGDAILLYGCSCPPVVGRVGCSTRSSPSVFPLSTAGIPSLIQTGAGAS